MACASPQNSNRVARPWFVRGVLFCCRASNCTQTALGALSSRAGSDSGEPTFCGLRQMLQNSVKSVNGEQERE